MDDLHIYNWAKVPLWMTSTLGQSQFLYRGPPHIHLATQRTLVTVNVALWLFLSPSLWCECCISFDQLLSLFEGDVSSQFVRGPLLVFLSSVIGYASSSSVLITDVWTRISSGEVTGSFQGIQVQTVVKCFSSEAFLFFHPESKRFSLVETNS